NAAFERISPATPLLAWLSDAPPGSRPDLRRPCARPGGTCERVGREPARPSVGQGLAPAERRRHRESRLSPARAVTRRRLLLRRRRAQGIRPPSAELGSDVRYLER